MADVTKPLSMSDFDYELPQGLIALEPAQNRDHSRLLVARRDDTALIDQTFNELSAWMRADDLLILNDTKVFPARLLGRKISGGKVEILAERIEKNGLVKAQLKSNRVAKVGTEIEIADKVVAIIEGREEEFFILRFATEMPILEIFERYGHVPLPPYIDRLDQVSDRERYQTVYAQKVGAVAAPTAGLHFSKPLLGQLQDQGISIASITLHVGAGTFKPVQVDDPSQHKMHSEVFNVSRQICDQVVRTKKKGGRVFAVGTTTLRALEAAAQDGKLKPMQGETNIFIYPGFTFRVVDALITNFHLPRSTLLMLVSAFAGHSTMRNAYEHAIRHRYRFYSYGDAMLIVD